MNMSIEISHKIIFLIYCFDCVVPKLLLTRFSYKIGNQINNFIRTVSKNPTLTNMRSQVQALSVLAVHRSYFMFRLFSRTFWPI